MVDINYCAQLIATATECGVRMFKTDLPGGEIVDPADRAVICTIGVAQYRHPASAYQLINVSAPLLSDVMNHATDIVVPSVLVVVFGADVRGLRLAPSLPYPLKVKQSRADRIAQKSGQPFDPGLRWYQFNPGKLIPLETVLDG